MKYNIVKPQIKKRFGTCTVSQQKLETYFASQGLDKDAIKDQINHLVKLGKITEIKTNTETKQSEK